MLRPRLATVLVLAALVAACGGADPRDDVTVSPTAATPSGDPTGGQSIAPESDAPGSDAPATEPPAETEPPLETAPPEDTPEPTDEATAPPAGSADACTGSEDNRKFFADVAAAVDWPVLCAALPKGWFVATGSYRLANGGKLVISYKGPGGATLALSEGAFCASTDGCVPAGTDAGGATLDGLDATLVELDGGGFAIVADRGAALSWLLEVHGVDEAATRSIGAALVVVEG
jgi:hypothetical protein